MPAHPQKNLHTLQHLPLQPRPAHILAQKTAVRGVEVERPQRLPDGVDLRGRQGDHVGVGPHEGVGGGEGVFSPPCCVVEARLHIERKGKVIGGWEMVEGGKAYRHAHNRIRDEQFALPV